jgi:hypothetical protein
VRDFDDFIMIAKMKRARELRTHSTGMPAFFHNPSVQERPKSHVDDQYTHDSNTYHDPEHDRIH